MDEKKFQSFMKNQVSVPTELDHSVHLLIQQKQEKMKKVFWPKLLGLHFFSGFVTLSFCPQFGFDPFRTQSGLPHLFMDYGMWACGLFCGVLFFSIGSFLTALLLSSDEFLYLRRHRYPLMLGLPTAALTSLMLIGAGQNTLTGFTGPSFLSFWFIGAVVTLLMAALLRSSKFLIKVRVT